MSIRLSSKLPEVGTTIFTVMSRMAAEHNAINLSQGYPDFDGPIELREALCRYVRDGYNQYSPLAGILKLREQIAAKVATLYNHSACPEQNITVVPGATEAIFCAIQATVHPGEEVIIFDPAYDSYEPSIRLCGAKAIRIPLLAPDFAVDWQQVSDRINSKTRMIIINNPHNPTGTVWNDRDIEQLTGLTANTDILLLSDEVYEHLVYDQRKHLSLLRYPELTERAFVISSFGKTYHVTGWKTGYCIAPQHLTVEFRKAHQFVSFVGVTPVQHALADFMEQHPEHCQELPAFYQQKRDLLASRLAQSKFKIEASAGTYFQMADYTEISDLPDTDFAEYLTKEIGVAAIPVSVFYETPPQSKLVRFCFCKENSTILEASERLCAI